MTNKTLFVTAMTLVALPFWQVRASAKTPITVADEARATLQRVAVEATGLESKADEFDSNMRDNGLDSESQTVMLESLKERINTIGREIRMTDSERAALPLWERQAVDNTMRLLKDAAATTEKAIGYFNEDTSHTWANPEYRACLSRVWNDSDQMTKSLNSYLELAKIQNKEHRLDGNLGVAAGSN